MADHDPDAAPDTESCFPKKHKGGEENIDEDDSNSDDNGSFKDEGHRSPEHYKALAEALDTQINFAMSPVWDRSSMTLSKLMKPGYLKMEGGIYLTGLLGNAVIIERSNRAIED
ncbi:conserved hypothetical protein [Histoplasma capsulatum G186AR]|uniref:Uncharacterized protein n=1 Tax=Ajellomyces capsulatus (strain G186AR / H82 / ATCC MYA-2454 / RMSCC 2432) TaxID=447093 RepID=C0NQY0_AJECG|nr:uncharacterized protein HCBG_05410 [Histoplasma capsulatum G186AR]EEH06094.1 conserved hypothetical protein [Histoplasma capsulatum G186AR]